MNNAFKNSPRTSHTISQSNSLRNIPSTSVRTAPVNKPAPLTGLSGRCASCGSGRRR